MAGDAVGQDAHAGSRDRAVDRGHEHVHARLFDQRGREELAGAVGLEAVQPEALDHDPLGHPEVLGAPHPGHVQGRVGDRPGQAQHDRHLPGAHAQVAQVRRAERVLDGHRARRPAGQFAQLGRLARGEVGLLDQDPQARALVAVDGDEAPAPDDLVPPGHAGRGPEGGGVAGLERRCLGQGDGPVGRSGFHGHRAHGSTKLTP